MKKPFETHVFVTTTGNKDVITKNHMYQMRDQAIVCNIGHLITKFK